MDLKQAQQLAWLHAEHPETSREALARLRETLRASEDALASGQLVAGQSRLEDALIQVLVAMHTFNLDAEPGFARALSRLQAAPGQKAFHLFTDRLEIRVGGETRGGWPLTSEADRQAACRLARELGCDIRFEEADQLALFNPLFHPMPEGAPQNAS